MNELVSMIIMDCDGEESYTKELLHTHSFMQEWSARHPGYTYKVITDKEKFVIQLEIYADNTEGSAGVDEAGSEGVECTFEFSIRGHIVTV